MLVHSSTQHPGEVSTQVAHALDVPALPTSSSNAGAMGGGSAAGDASPDLFACVAALLAKRNRPTGQAPRRTVTTT